MKNKISEVYTQLLNRSQVPSAVQKQILVYAETHKVTPLLRQLALLENVDTEIENALKNSKYSNVQAAWAGRKERTSKELLEIIATKPKAAVLDAIASRTDLEQEVADEIFLARGLAPEVALKLLVNSNIKVSAERLKIAAKRAAKANMETLEGLLHRAVRARPEMVALMADEVNSKVAESISRWGDYGRDVNLKLLAKILEESSRLPHEELLRQYSRAAFKDLINEIFVSENIFEKLHDLGLPVFTDHNLRQGDVFVEAVEAKLPVEEYKQQILKDPSGVNGVDFMFYPGLTADDALEVLNKTRSQKMYWNWSAELFALRFPQETKKNVEVMLHTPMMDRQVEYLVGNLTHPAEAIELLVDTIVGKHLSSTSGSSHRETLLELLMSPFFTPETVLKCPIFVLSSERLPSEALTYLSQRLEEKFGSNPGKWEIFESFVNDERNQYHQLGFILEMIESL